MRSALLDLSVQPDLQQPPEAGRDAGSVWANPVIPGDHPDPSIIRVGQHFWAAATSSEWSPQFPLFRSTDLIHWSPAGSIFPQQPRWAEGAFWAPELVHDRGRTFVYYVARNRGGPLCVAVASAAKPGGPWTDHGPIVCDPLGSIDPCFARDEHGAPFLIWKEDGNSQQKPTPIFAQPLAPDMIHLLGARTMLITNDTPWEGELVEGPSIIRHAHHFYLFYAGNTCCGRDCRYAEGVARAEHLLGPWEKFPGNPLINANDHWRCPGHGTAVHGMHGQDYLLYHAYPAGGTIYVGREAVLDRIAWGADGWPRINSGRGPAATPAGRPSAHSGIQFADDFSTPRLGASWQWPVNTHPSVVTGDGVLRLRIPNTRQAAILAVPAPGVPEYRAAVTLDTTAPQGDALPSSAWCGLSVIGDPFNTIGLGLRGRTVELWQRAGAHASLLWSADLTPRLNAIHLQVTAAGEAQLHFALSTDGETWRSAGRPVDASSLPVWDRGLRVGLHLEGPAATEGSFRAFCLETIG